VSAHGNPLDLALGEHGLVVRAIDLWLDPVGEPRLAAPATAFVSHIHAATRVAAGPSLASPETIALMAALDRPSLDVQALAWGETVERPVGARFGGGTARLSIAPAGHVLGGAQLVIDHPRGRLVYTGDWCGEVDATRPAGEAIPCDEIVITSTFGLPIFRFRPMSIVLADVAGWCSALASDGITPVLLVQTPGPAQALARSLTRCGLTVVAGTEVRRACSAYESLGVAVGAIGEPGGLDRGEVVLVPAQTRRPDIHPPKKHSVAYVSPWAALDAAVAQKRADAAFVLADQADYDRSMALVRETGARSVYVTRGAARPLAYEIRRRGVHAEALDLGPIDDRGAS
jgi:putative mRNA 3-end processing factor